MKPLNLVMAFWYAALIPIGILAVAESTELVETLISVGFMLTFATGAALNLHVYINKGKR